MNVRENPSAEAAPPVQKLLFEPNISINGAIDESTVAFFLGRLEAARRAGEDMVMELNTNGGDADAARRIALEVRLFRRHSGKQARCVGKTKVYSAGVTIFAAFPRQCRFLTEDAVLLVHERRLEKSIQLCGPMKASIQIVAGRAGRKIRRRRPRATGRRRSPRPWRRPDRRQEARSSGRWRSHGPVLPQARC